MTAHIEVPARPLTLADWEGLTEDESRRYELVDGGLLVSPKPSFDHGSIAAGLIVRLHQVIPGNVKVVPEVDVLIAADPATVRAPDVVVADRSAHRSGSVLDPSLVRLAVEIVSPSSRRTDYVSKRFDYADAGIPWYWIVDGEKRSVTCLRLVDSDYVEYPVDIDGDQLKIAEPYPISFSWLDLLS